MKLPKALFTFFITSFLSVSFSASENSFEGIPYFFGADFLFHKRVGSFLFDSVEKRQNIPQPNLLQGGVCFGKQYYMVPWLRFQIMGLFHFGKNKKNTTYYVEDYSFRHAGCDIDIHFIIQENKKNNLFLLAGGGFNYMHTVTETDSPDFNGFDVTRWCPSANGGAGFDIKLRPTLGLNITYVFRFWQPVKYLYKTDLPVKALDFKETFYSHIIQVKLLFNFTGD
jgi:hypothetical protein